MAKIPRSLLLTEVRRRRTPWPPKYVGIAAEIEGSPVEDISTIVESKPRRDIILEPEERSAGVRAMGQKSVRLEANVGRPSLKS